MARAIAQRKVQNFTTGKLTPQQEPSDSKPIIMFTKPQGEDHITPLSSLGQDGSPYVENLRVSIGGRYVTRDGTYSIGGMAANPIIGAAVFILSTYINYIVRVTTVGVEIYIGGAWTALSGPTLNVPAVAVVEFSVWDMELMFTDTVSGLYTIDFNLFTYTLIPEAPIGLHLTTFDSRTIVHNLNQAGLPSRIQWSVKNDNTDWIGEGSGFEDLLSSPGGVVDTQHAIIPVSDSEAFVLRQSSMWVINTTGLFDTPFQFTEHFDQGTFSPDTCVRIPGEKISQQTIRTLFAQIICLGTDDVVMMKLEGVFPLAFPIRDQILSGLLDASRATADFEPRLREYRLYVPPWAGSNVNSVVWRYNIDTHLWTHDRYPIQISRLFAKDFVATLVSIGQLQGTISAQTGTFGNWGNMNTSPSPGCLFIDTIGNQIVKEDPSTTTDVNSAGVNSGIAIELRTGLLAVPNPLVRTLIGKVEVEYEASISTSANIDYSTDGGNSWTNYGVIALPVTTTPTVLAYRYPREALQVMLRVTCASASGVTIRSITPSMIEGSSINS